MYHLSPRPYAGEMQTGDSTIHQRRDLAVTEPAVQVRGALIAAV